MTGFGEAVRAQRERYGPLCVGIDPHASLLQSWGLTDDADGARAFGLRVVQACAGNAGFVKPQVSFFERHGADGIAALQDVLAAARATDLIVIADAKRGDIGSTMDAYAEAWLTPGAPLEADALTVNPYLGVGALTGTFARARDAGKGIFVLAATSNPEATQLQQARLTTGTTVAAAIVEQVAEENRRHATRGEWGDIGLVIGATVDMGAMGIQLGEPLAPILAPGFGFQGASRSDLPTLFGDAEPAVLASESRSILSVGTERLEEAIRGN